MKKLALILAGVMMLASLAACGTTGGEAKEAAITLATGGTSGTYYAVGGVLQNVLNDKAASKAEIILAEARMKRALIRKNVACGK